MTTRGLDTLRLRRPEWTAWLDVLEATLAESTSPGWDPMVPMAPFTDGAAPLLSDVSVSVDRAAVGALFDRLLDAASGSDLRTMSTLRAVPGEDVDMAEMFRASVCQDADGLSRVAAAHGADADAVHAIAPLLAMPFLHSCRRRWGSSLRDTWRHGYCPICASWPSFAEVRGIERSRYLRCGRCGAEWRALLLRCAYCGTTDHEQLATLIPEKEGSAVVESCRRCKGYVKVFTRLQGCRPHEVLLEDLDSVEFDLSAIEQGFARREGTGTALTITVTSPAPQRCVEWNA